MDILEFVQLIYSAVFNAILIATGKQIPVLVGVSWLLFRFFYLFLESYNRIVFNFASLMFSYVTLYLYKAEEIYTDITWHFYVGTVIATIVFLVNPSL